ncbi:DUF6973 domain-containing protein [Nocardia sp. NBC_01009]|uniref:DUF6973 domain-containing protein n=1 Tax=Nocardia sp. NBC_01009 TaxID=2975996 RepID=UPI003863DA00|nr:hypothetical protein OHA42_37965 [Nocardia sp. NBC_01009]
MSSLPPTKSQIRSWNVAPLADQGLEWGRGVKTITDEHGAVSRQLADSPGFWRGPASDAMRDKGTEALSSMSKVATAFEKGELASPQIAQTLGFAKTTAVNAIATAEEQKFIVAESGAVGYDDTTVGWLLSYPDTSWLTADYVLRAIAKQHESDIVKALQAAADAAENARKSIENAFADVPIPPGAVLDRILVDNQVEADPGGMVKWPDGALATLMGLKPGFEPQSVTEAEAAMLEQLSLGDKIRFYNIKTEAEETAESLFPNENTQDNHTDAYRHAYWNALMTQEFGEDWTKEYTSKHEGRPDNAAVREAMDLYNNEIGRKIALANPDASQEQLQDLVKDAVDRGDTVLINQNQSLSFTNQVGQGQAVDSSEFDKNPQFLPGTPSPNDRPSPK